MEFYESSPDFGKFILDSDLFREAALLAYLND